MVHSMQFAILVVFPALVIVAAMSDLVSFTISNRISIAVALAFVPAALALGLPMGVVGQHLAAGAVALLVGVAMFGLGWIGGGDAKLFSAVILWLGLPAITTFLLVTALAGGGLALVLINLRTEAIRPFMRGGAWVERLAQPGGAAPYGVAIAVGALAAFPQSSLAAAFVGS